MNGRDFGSNGCPTSEALRDFGIGRLCHELIERIAAHLENCENCEETMSSLNCRLEFRGCDSETQYEDEPDYLVARDFIARIPSQFAEPIPESIAGYEVLDRLGRGGMGVVYKVWDNALERYAVVKVLRSARLASESAVGQFKRELQAIGNLRHPAIVQAFHGGFLPDGQPYLVMEYLEGKTLYEMVKRNGPMSETTACAVFRDVTSGVRFMHENGLVHRDIKPSNVMVLADGSAKVLDLGLAEKTSAESTEEIGIRGSLQYMAPEQALGKDVDEKTDVFGLGGTLFFALTGQASFRVDHSLSKAEILAAVNERKRRPVQSLVGLSRKLSEVIDRSQSVNSAERPTLKEVEQVLAKRFPRTWYYAGIATVLLACLLFWLTRAGNESGISVDGKPNLRGLFTDDFWDGTYSKWEVHDITGWKGRWEVKDKQFHIYTEETVKMGCLYASQVEGDKNYDKFANGTYTFKMSLDNQSTVAGGLFRLNRENHDGYFVNVCVAQDGQPCVSVSKVDDWAFESLERARFDFRPGEPFLVRTEFYGPSISVTVWKEHMDVPSTPAIVLEDTDFGSGTIALLVGSNKFWKPGPLGAIFDDVYFEVPER